MELRPHRHRYFLTSHDPDYDAKVRDVVGLYLEPPPGATVLSLDEKPNIQALGRRNPELPMRPGYPVAREFEYVRHGVLHLFGAFNVRTGRVLGEVFPDKNQFRFVDLLDRCAWRYRSGDVHCIVDNASYHMAPAVQEWHCAHPRFVFHFTPTHASWLNQIEVWFSLLSRKVLARGDFGGRRALRTAVHRYMDYWNLSAQPFNWRYGSWLLRKPVHCAA